MPVLCAVFFVYSPLYAQVNVERATSEVDSLSRDEEKLQRRLRPLQQKSVEIKTEEAAASKKEEEQAFFVKTINLIGCESVSPEIFSSRIAKYENREAGNNCRNFRPSAGHQRRKRHFSGSGSQDGGA
jgi:hypothetical protein